MTPGEWDELEFVYSEEDERYKELLKKTNSEDEHPDDYNGPCFCKTCLSYTD